MFPRAVLSSTRSGVFTRIPRRNYNGIKDWKRPSMDEYLVPTENWSHVHARNNSKYNLHLAFGASFLIGTIAFGTITEILKFPTMPQELIYKTTCPEA